MMDTCKHVGEIKNSPIPEMVTSKSECRNCKKHKNDPILLCLHCMFCYCKSHQKEHFLNSKHSIFVSLKELSFKCSSCDIMLDVTKYPTLEDIYAQLQFDQFLSVPPHFEPTNKKEDMIEIKGSQKNENLEKYLKKFTVEKQYLIKTLLELVQVDGTTYNEDIILDYISKKIENEKIPNIKVKNCLKIGIKAYKYPPEKKNAEYTLLFDAHVDKVQRNFVLPKILSTSDDLLCCTALDNRGSVALLLTILKFYVPKHIKLLLLFSIEEEANTEQIDEITVFDVTFGKMSDGSFKETFTLHSGTKFGICDQFFNGNSELIPKVGSGASLTLSRDYEKKLMVLNEDKIKLFESTMNRNQDLGGCNAAGFLYGNLKKVSKSIFSFPVVDMHHLNSFASIKDICSLYDFLKCKLEYVDDLKIIKDLPKHDIYDD